MPTPTPFMALALPTDHGSDSIWGPLLSTVFGKLDAHDHSTGNGTKIRPTSLQIDADVTWSFGGTNYAVTNVKALDFAPLPASTMTGYASALFVDTLDNNLYFRNQAGTNVKITDAGTLNVSIVGGIGGDYAPVAALLSFDDATDRYLLQQQGSPRPWAGLAMGRLDLHEQAASITNRIRIQSPTALAASYALTLPAALPAAGITRPIQVSDTGAVTCLQVTTKLHFSAANWTNMTPANITNTALDVTTGGFKCVAGTGQFVLGALSGLVEGQQLVGVDIDHLKTSAGSTFIRLHRSDSSGDTIIAAATLTAAGTLTTTLTPSATEYVNIGRYYWIEFGFAAVGDYVKGAVASQKTV